MRRYPHNLPSGIRYLDKTIIRKKATCSLQSTVDFVELICHRLIEREDPTIVPIFNFKRLKPVGGAYTYYYDMQALLMLTHDEQMAILDASASWEDEELYPSQWQSSNLYHENLQKAWANCPLLMQFLDRLIKEDRYHDVHDGNIMIDEQDQYRIIDLEGFVWYPLDHPTNEWLRV